MPENVRAAARNRTRALGGIVVAMDAAPEPAGPARFQPEDGWFAGRRVTVMGLGRFGGGVGVARWLAERGADVLVTDRASAEELAGPVSALDELVRAGSVELRLGEHNVSDFTTADAVVVNPAVPRPWENRFVRVAEAGGVPLLTEIGLVVDRLDLSRVVAVTGSAGKSTTASMCRACLEHAGVRAHLGGNIGGSMLGGLGEVGHGDVVVLEVSSAMLWWLGGPRGDAFSPGVAVVTGFAPNHLDWHGNEGHYLACKRNLLRGLYEGASAVLGPGVHGWAVPGGVRAVCVERSDAVDGLGVPGAHNGLNAAMAVTAAELVSGADRGALVEGARAFGGLPHRLCLVGTFGGVRCIDDSKSTTPEATALALDAVRSTLGDGGSIHLIAGGYDKGVDLSPMFADVRSVAGVQAIGATAGTLAEMQPGLVRDCGTLEAAVRGIAASARPGDVVLLSPGCASWDQFEHFEARGRAFAELVRRELG